MCKHNEIFQRNGSSLCTDELFQPADQSRVTRRRSKFKLNLPFRKSSAGQKCLSNFGPKKWNSLFSDLKSANSVNSFKHKIKDNFLKRYRERKKTYRCPTKTTRPLSHFVSRPYSGYAVSKGAFQYNVYM